MRGKIIGNEGGLVDSKWIVHQQGRDIYLKEREFSTNDKGSLIYSYHQTSCLLKSSDAFTNPIYQSKGMVRLYPVFCWIDGYLSIYLYHDKTAI